MKYLRVVLLLLSCSAFGEPTPITPDWSAGALVLAPRSNPYGWDAETLARYKRQGQIHALNYPIEVSGALGPWESLRSFLDERQPDPIKAILKTIFGSTMKIKSTDDLFAWLGLHSYPANPAQGEIPYPGTARPTLRMGASTFDFNGAQALTLSCATCHAGEIFGKRILGMTNRFPRANEFFVQGKKITEKLSPGLFNLVMNPSKEELAIYKQLRERARAIEARTPTVEGLDSAVAQVVLSLTHRNIDEWATFNPDLEKSPRANPVREFIADSKPMPWWNVKYKNRWTADGAVVSGNPIYTNIIWNEIGRGTDLKALSNFLKERPQMIDEYATAVFSSEAPLITEFYPAEKLKLARAKKGEALFGTMCSKCHGSYVKNWSLPNAESLPLVEQLKTAEVRYHMDTPVINVGTDPNRAKAGQWVAEALNPLAILKEFGIKLEPQNGYVPPPLVGIWARFPYFHNNSAPNLCAVLTPASQRPKSYQPGEIVDRERDYDWECGGYPLGEKTPKEWFKSKARFYDTTKPGLSNSGHDERIFVKNGVYLLEGEKRGDLIEFLKTL